MSSLIMAESAIFTIFVMAYLYYLGRDIAGPTPREVLEIPIFRYSLPALEQLLHLSRRTCDRATGGWERSSCGGR